MQCAVKHRQQLRLYPDVLRVFFHFPSCQIAPQMCKKWLINEVFLSIKTPKVISDAAVFEFTDLRIVVTVCCVRLYLQPSN